MKNVKDVDINLKLKLDSAKFTNQIRGLEKDFKPLEIDVKLKPSSIPSVSANLKFDDKITGDLTQSLKGAFKEVSLGLGESIGEQINKAVTSLKPSVFDNLISGITSPFKQIATGALEGVGIQISSNLGKGLAKGVEKSLSPTIGSLELLGEKLATRIIPGAYQGTEVAKLVDKILGAEIKLNKQVTTARQVIQELTRATTSAIGERDVLIESRSSASRSGKIRSQKLQEAKAVLVEEFKESVGAIPGRQAKAQQLKQKDMQLASEQGQLQREASVAGRELQAKRQQLIERPLQERVKKLESAGKPVDEVQRAQIRKEISLSKEVVAALLPLEKENARTLNALNSVTKQRRQIASTIASLSNPLSPVIRQLEVLGFSAEEIKSIQQKGAESTKSIDSFIRKISTEIEVDLNEVENLKSKVAQAKKQYQELTKDFELLLQFADTPEEQQTLKQEYKQNVISLAQEIRQDEQDIKNLIQKVSASRTTGQEAIKERQLKSERAREELIAAQVKFARELSGEKPKPQRAKKVSEQQESQPQLLPEAYLAIVRKTAEKSGIKIKDEDIPKLVGLTDRGVRSAGWGGSYARNKNAIELKQADYELIAKGVVDKRLTEVIVHELRHALQSDFGRDPGSRNFGSFLSANEQEKQTLSPRINASLASGLNQTKYKKGHPLYSQIEEVIRKTEEDAYVFAERHTEEIFNFINAIAQPEKGASKKLSEKQRQLKHLLKNQQVNKEFKDLTSENEANLQQLTSKQLKQIAKSSGMTGYSKKKISELRSDILQSVAPEDLSFKIPFFSKIDPQIQQKAQQLLQLAPNQLQLQLKELSKNFSKSIKIAGKSKDEVQLRSTLDSIAEAKKIYTAALAENISEETRNFLKSSVASLGKQRIAAQSRLTVLDAQKLNSRNTRPTDNSVSVADPWNDLLPDVQFAFTQDPGKGLSNARAAMMRLAALARTTENSQRLRESGRITRNSKNSSRDARLALQQLEASTNQQVADIEQNQRARQGKESRQLRSRLMNYGIYQDQPAGIVERPAQAQRPSIGKAFSFLRGEFRESQVQRQRKQAEILGTQAQALLIDLDSQIAIGKRAAAESQMLQKQINQNEKKVQQLLNKLRSGAQGKEPPLSPGDLQRLTGQFDELSKQIAIDKARISQLTPQAQKAKELSPLRAGLKTSTSSASEITEKRNVSREDLLRLSQFNKQSRELLIQLGQSPPSGGFLEKLKLQLPETAEKLSTLIRGFVGFKVLSAIVPALKQVGVEAFQVSMRFEALEKSLAFASGGEFETAKNLKFLREEITRLSLPIEESTKGFTGLTAAARGTSLEGEATRKIFSAVAQAGRVYNLSAEDTQGALLAVQQMISKGTVSAEELRGQFGERIPGAMQIAARALDVTTSELGKMLEQGKVTSEEFLPLFAKQLSSETAGGVTGATKTAAAALQRLQNNLLDVKRSIGDAIQPAVIVVLNGISSAMDFAQKNANLVRAALAGVALTVTIAMLPSIIALGSALATLATVTLPLVVGAFGAIVLANPVLVASLAVLTVGLLTAESAAKNLANALEGVSQVEIDQADADVAFDAKYSKAIQQLQKQIPLAKEEIDSLSEGLADQARRGVSSARTSELLTNQLLKLQAQAESTAKSQRELSKSVTDSEVAFKKAKGALELTSLRDEAKLANQRGKETLSEDAYKDKQYEIEQQNNFRLAAIYQDRIKTINNHLLQSKKLQDAGKKGLDAKQEADLRKEAIDLEKDLLESQKKTSEKELEFRKVVRERRFKDFEEAKQLNEYNRKQGAISEGDFAKGNVNVSRSLLDEQIKDIQSRRKLLNKNDKEGLEALMVEQSKAYADYFEVVKNEHDRRINHTKTYYDQRRTIEQSERDRGLQDETQFAQENTRLQVEQGELQLEIIKQRRSQINQADKEGLEQLAAQEAQALTEISNARKQGFEQQVADIKADAEERFSILNSDRSRGLISDIQFNELQLNQKEQALNEELDLIRKRRLELNQADKEGLEQLAAQEAQALAEIANARKQFFEQELQDVKQNSEQRLAILSGDRAQGLLSEAQFNEAQFKDKQAALEEELFLIKERRQQISAADIEGNLELAAKEGEVYQRRLENQKAFLDSQLQQLERQQQKAKDLTVESSLEREKELQSLINQGIVRQEEVETEKINLARKSIEEELNLEQEKLKKLNEFPAYNDPVAEEERQGKIRSSRIRTSEIQLRLLQNEKQQQEAVHNAYVQALGRVTQAIQNRANAATAPLNREIQLNNSIEKSLQLQNQLLDAKKSLHQAIANYASSEFDFLKEGAKSEKEKAILAESAAAAKLEAARVQADLDKQSLELQIQQTEQSQRRLEIENAIALIRNQADQAGAKGKLKIAMSDPNATPEQRQEAKLNYEASLLEGQGLLLQREMLGKERENQGKVNMMRRQSQQIESASLINRSEADYVNSIADPRKRRKAQREVRSRRGQSLTGVDPTSNYGDYIQSLSAYNASMRGEALTPLQSWLAGNVARNISPVLPGLTTQATTMPAFEKSVTDFSKAIDSLVSLVDKKLSQPPSVTIGTPINNYYSTPEGKKSAAQVTQEIRKELRDLGVELGR